MTPCPLWTLATYLDMTFLEYVYHGHANAIYKQMKWHFQFYGLGYDNLEIGRVTLL